MTTGLKLPSRLSYSSLASYAECGERWRLERGYRIKGGTWWATLAGTAIHDVTELYDRGEIELAGDFEADRSVVAELFEAALDKAVAKARERDGEIRASGRVQKTIGKSGGPNKKDREWWSAMGPDYIMRYVEWRLLTGWSIAIMPDGEPGIEVPLTVDLGDRPQLGFVDRVFITPRGHTVIVDIKTGSAPASTLQLGVYRVALLKQFGIDADYGAYWLGSDGEIMSMVDLTNFSDEYIEAQFDMAWRGIEAGVFLPNVTSMCNGCGVRDYCRAKNGRLAGSLPIVDTLVPATRPAPSPREVV